MLNIYINNGLTVLVTIYAAKNYFKFFSVNFFLPNAQYIIVLYVEKLCTLQLATFRSNPSILWECLSNMNMKLNW